ncbi:PilN domain-containing protein [Aurantivibrio plasticivorans]
MANINLLPWRDAKRQEKKKEFFTVLGGFAILGVLCAYVWISAVQGTIDNQNSRNNMLQSEIDALQKQVAEIQELKKRRAELLERMKVIQDLQGTRPVIVRYFDELVRAVPEGVYLTSLSRGQGTLNIEGAAESLNRISSLMRNLENSEWFNGANMSKIDESADNASGSSVQKFTMTVNTTAPKKEGEEEGNG